MSDFQMSDMHHLRAAVGWIELGNQREANAELDKITPALQSHCDILELRWRIFSTLEDWGSAARVTQNLCEHYPDKPTSWVNLAYATRRAEGGGLEKARDVLLPAAQKFPKEPTIPYNLACYAAQFGQLDEAWDWLRIAARVAGKTETIKQMALKDPDLQSLRQRILQL